MNEWPDRFKLLAILATTKFLLSRSCNEGWGGAEPKESKEKIEQILCVILGDDNAYLPEYYGMLFGPTGPLQEISIANGWSEAFLKLADEYDQLSFLISEKTIESKQTEQ